MDKVYIHALIGKDSLGMSTMVAGRKMLEMGKKDDAFIITKNSISVIGSMIRDMDKVIIFINMKRGI